MMMTDDDDDDDDDDDEYDEVLARDEGKDGEDVLEVANQGRSQAIHLSCCMMKLLLWLVLLSGPAHPPKVKYSLSSCYCGLFVWSLPFRTSTPSQM